MQHDAALPRKRSARGAAAVSGAPAGAVPVAAVRQGRVGAEEVVLAPGDHVLDLGRDRLLAPRADVGLGRASHGTHVPLRTAGAGLPARATEGERRHVQGRVRFIVGALPRPASHQSIMGESPVAGGRWQVPGGGRQAQNGERGAQNWVVTAPTARSASSVSTATRHLSNRVHGWEMPRPTTSPTCNCPGCDAPPGALARRYACWSFRFVTCHPGSSSAGVHPPSACNSRRESTTGRSIPNGPSRRPTFTNARPSSGAETTLPHTVAAGRI